MSDKKKHKAASFADAVFKGKLKKSAKELEIRGNRIDAAVDGATGSDELTIKKRKR